MKAGLTIRHITAHFCTPLVIAEHANLHKKIVYAQEREKDKQFHLRDHSRIKLRSIDRLLSFWNLKSDTRDPGGAQHMGPSPVLQNDNTEGILSSTSQDANEKE